MTKMTKQEIPLELVDVILKHKPGASVEMISEVISEWGDFFDDQKFLAPESIDLEAAKPNRGQQRAS